MDPVLHSFDTDSNVESYSRPTPRERRWPLVPEPFRKISLSRQTAFLGSEASSSLAARFGGFAINLNIPQYREQQDDNKRTELDKRADHLNNRAILNDSMKVSEFCWEADAWHDVFGLIRADKACRIDKRPYEFIERVDGQLLVKQRISDATMGLKSYNDFDLKNGYLCTVTDCRIDHAHEQPQKTLSESRIKLQMYMQECGLMVDGVWGETDILFPFAVYEAKKKVSSFDQARNQIYHACRTYLAMMDDLARVPSDVSKYQTEGSKQQQIFALMSCGYKWEVYAVWQFFGSCFIETIWEGDIRNFSGSYDLICIVDQIHDFAITQHRQYVISHLEPWLIRAEEIMTLRLSQQLDQIEKLEIGEFLDSLDYGLLDTSSEIHTYQPEWVKLKELSKRVRNTKAAQTRKRNLLSRSQGHTSEIITQTSSNISN